LFLAAKEKQNVHDTAESISDVRFCHVNWCSFFVIFRKTYVFWLAEIKANNVTMESQRKG